MMKADHASRPGRVDIFDVRTRCDVPILQGKNPIGADDGVGTMRYDDACYLKVTNRAVHLLFVKDIQMARCFVEEEVLRFAVKSAGQEEPLFLPAGER